MFNQSYQLYGLINTKSLVTQLRPICTLRFHRNSALEQLHKNRSITLKGIFYLPLEKNLIT